MGWGWSIYISNALNSPDEYAFTSPLPAPILPPLEYPNFLYPNDINVTSKIMDMYISSIVPSISADGDDQQYGSSATRDIECLQALSRRIHYGNAELWDINDSLLTFYFDRQIHCREQVQR